MANAHRFDSSQRNAVEEEVLNHWKNRVEKKLGCHGMALEDLYLFDQFPQMLKELLSEPPELEKTFQRSPHFFEAKLQQILVEFAELRKALEEVLEGDPAIILATLDQRRDEIVLRLFSDLRMVLQSETVEAQTDAERIKFAAVSGRTYFWEWDSMTGLVWRSQGFDEIHGIQNSGQKLTLEDFYSCAHPDDQEELKKTIWHAQENGKNWIQLNYRVYDREKKIRTLKANGYLYRDGHGRLIRMAGVVTETQ